MSQPGPSPLKLVILVATMVIAFAIVSAAPNPVVALAILWVVALLLPYVLGPILLRRSQKIGMDETSEPVDLGGDEVPRDVSATYRFVDDELARLGFERLYAHVDRGRAAHATGYLAIYRHRETKEVAQFLGAVAANRQVRKFAPALHLSSEFADGTEVNTVNGRSPRVFPKLGPPVHSFEFPEVGEVARLVGLHRALVRGHEGGRIRVDPLGADPVGFQRRRTRRLLDHLVAIGYYHADEDQRVLRLSWKGAILMAWQLAWPVRPLVSASRKARSARLIRQLESEGRDGGFHAYR